MKRLIICLSLLLIVVPLSSVTAAEYLIGSEDVIEVMVWKEPDFSRQVVVRPDGKISLPVVGDVQAAGLTPDTLARKLAGAISEYVKTPKVSVIVLQINSRKVYVMGKVASPGAFPLQGEMTVLEAISLAGGFAEWAKKSSVVILRKTAKGDARIEIDLNDVIKGKEEHDIRLQPGDRIVVP